MIDIIPKPKLMIMGYAEHGKDTICHLLHEIFGLTSISSSYMALDLFMFDKLKDQYGYQTKEECYADRYDKRDIWYEDIKAYNTPDGCRLARDLYAQYNIYNGVRNIEEFIAIKEAKLFDYAIWVDAIQRKPAEPLSSCSVEPKDADIILSNNGPLHRTTKLLIDQMLKLYPVLR